MDWGLFRGARHFLACPSWSNVPGAGSSFVKHIQLVWKNMQRCAKARELMQQVDNCGPFKIC